MREARTTVVNFIGMMMPVLAKNPEQTNDADNTVRLLSGVVRPRFIIRCRLIAYDTPRASLVAAVKGRSWRGVVRRPFVERVL